MKCRQDHCASEFSIGGFDWETTNFIFAIGANRNNPANNLFNGLIDWITWKNTAD